MTLQCLVRRARAKERLIPRLWVRRIEGVGSNREACERDLPDPAPVIMAVLPAIDSAMSQIMISKAVH